jgi:hypothetical protein
VNPNKLVIVTGVTGDLGRAYDAHYAADPSVRCVGITRQQDHDNPRWKIANLLDKREVEYAIRGIPLRGIEEIILIHPVGRFKFEDAMHPIVDQNQDGFDDEVCKSNISTFENVVSSIFDRLGGRMLTVCQFGSISDRYESHIPFWRSYSHAKNVLRERGQALSALPRVKSRFFSLSSVKTSAEQKTRLFADMTYWITPQEVVERSVPLIESRANYVEAEIFNPDPAYTNNYFLDTDTLYTKWKREMGEPLEEYHD